MLKTILTLMRGAAAAAEEEVVDRNALLILDQDQQIRDAAGAIERGKRALALAIAHDEAEGKRLDNALPASPTSRSVRPRRLPAHARTSPPRRSR